MSFVLIRFSLSPPYFPFEVTHRISFKTCPQSALQRPIIAPAGNSLGLRRHLSGLHSESHPVSPSFPRSLSSTSHPAKSSADQNHKTCKCQSCSVCVCASWCLSVISRHDKLRLHENHKSLRSASSVS